MALIDFAGRGLRKVGRSISRAGSAATYAGSSPKALAGIGAVAFAAGVANEAGPAARDAAFESTLGTPDADRYFTGRKFSARFLAGTAMGGPLGGALQSTAPSEMFATGQIGAVTGNPAGHAAGMAAIGGISGGALGARHGGSAKAKILGAIGGSITGGAVGGALPFAAAGQYARSNREFFSQSPYGRSTANNDLSAVGDIVLGMHNSRRGY
jgi:hypothetical protein